MLGFLGRFVRAFQQCQVPHEESTPVEYQQTESDRAPAQLTTCGRKSSYASYIKPRCSWDHSQKLEAIPPLLKGATYIAVLTSTYDSTGKRYED